MIKDAAIATLSIQTISLKYGMILKDGSIYNIQFEENKPIFIDILSFEKIENGKPWSAYGQFCRHFLAPLALLSYVDVNLQKIYTIYLDGFPLDFTMKLLPLKAKFNFGIFLHLYLHNKFIANNQTQKTSVKKSKISIADLKNQANSFG